MKTRNAALVVLGIAMAGIPVGETFGQSIIVTYGFNQVTTSSGTTDPTAPPTAPGATFGPFTAVGYTGNPNAGGRFSWQANPQGGVNGSDDFSQFTGSLSPVTYFEVSVTPLNSFALRLDTLSFTIQRSGTGIRSYAVRASVDGYTANLPASISPANANLGVGPGSEFRWMQDAITTAQNGSLVTLGAPFASLTSTVTFRFYGWNAEGSLGTFSLDNVTFSGFSVPEPSAGALIIFGLAVWGVRRRRAANC